MADNYLENRMDDYRRAQAAGLRRFAQTARPSGKPVSTGLTFLYPEMRVYIPDATSSPVGETLIRALMAAGVDVDFSGTPSPEANRIAQRYGARFYPLTERLNAEAALRMAEERCSVVAAISPEIIHSLPPTTLPLVSLPADIALPSPDACATLLAVLIHPTMRELTD